MATGRNFLGNAATPNNTAALEDQGGKARCSEIGRSGEAIVAGPDDHRVVVVTVGNSKPL